AYDSPDKVYKKKQQSGEIKSITTKLDAAIQSAEESLIIVTPYFVPQKGGIEYLKKLRERGIEVTVITNSLRATNHDVVHSGYVPARKPLLEAGVRILEVKASGNIDDIDRGGFAESLATLHTKAFLVDCKNFFIGSFNWDPRSVNINTELGVIIESEEITIPTCKRVEQQAPIKAYELKLNEKGKVTWVDNEGPEPVILTKEPETTFWQRFKVGFYRLLPIKSQL
ncbi:MAG: phospholipase D-like domain-containing protein, partial [Gammaproteobacteria bacterium]